MNDSIFPSVQDPKGTSATSLVHGPGCFGYYKDYLQAIGGEPPCVPAEGDVVAYEQDKEIVWQTVFSDATDWLDYIDVFGIDKETPGVAYAFCRLDSPKSDRGYPLDASAYYMWRLGV